MLFEHFQSWWFNHFPGQPGSMLEKSFSEEFFLICNLNLSWCNLSSFCLVLLLTLEKGPMWTNDKIFPDVKQSKETVRDMRAQPVLAVPAQPPAALPACSGPRPDSSSSQPLPGPGQWITEKKALVPIPVNFPIKAIKWITNSVDLSERICGNLLNFFSKMRNLLHRWAAVGGVGCCLMSCNDSWDREAHSRQTAVWKFFRKVCSKIFYNW